jgi:hypothetical protein
LIDHARFYLSIVLLTPVPFILPGLSTTNNDVLCHRLARAGQSPMVLHREKLTAHSRFVKDLQTRVCVC